MNPIEPLPRRTVPQDATEPFVGPNGWVGADCPCGQFRASARSKPAVLDALRGHQETDGCEFGVHVRKRKAESAGDDSIE